VRKIVLEAAGKQLSDPFDDQQSFEDVLLEPTLIYAKAIRQVLNHYKVKSVVHGIAHVTGGGLAENIERILPEGMRVEVDAATWERPPIFPWLQEHGKVATEEMFRVFNMGIGLAVIVSPYYAEMIRRLLDRNGLKNWLIGSVSAGQKSVTVINQ